MEGIDIKENMIALVGSTLLEIEPDEVFEIIGIEPITTRDEHIEYLEHLKENGYSYRQIGRMYNVSGATIYKRIKRRMKT